MTALADSIATIESVCAIVAAQNAARKSERRDMRVSEEEYAEMQAKRSRWTTGGVVNTDSMDAAVAPRMNSEPGNPELDKRAMYRPSHQSASGDSATASPDQSMSGGVESRHAVSSRSGDARPATNPRIAGVAPGPLTSLPRPYERDILAACLQALELHPRVSWVYRMNCGGMQNTAGQYVKFGFKGMADITGQLKDGRRLEVECKRPGESLTLDQQAFLHRVIACGGVAFVARSVDDVMRALQPRPEAA